VGDPRQPQSLQFIDDAFASAAAAMGDAVPCRRGCLACCAAVFDIHPVDAMLLGAWLDRQDEPRRAVVLERAADVAAQVEAAAGEMANQGLPELRSFRAEDGFEGLSAASITALAAAVELSCPLLGPDGACGAYFYRPAPCRMQGLPWRDPASGLTVTDFCQLDPQQAGVSPQPLDLGRLDGLRLEAAEAVRTEGSRSRVSRGRGFVSGALLRWNGARSP
jgi:Fe-S-cluster containining protein